MQVEILRELMVVGVPLLIAALGELIAERAGLLNLSIEGTMVFGAFVGWIVARNSFASVSLASAALAGALIGFIFFLLVDIAEVQQHVCGLGIGFTLQGATLTAFRLVPAEFKETALAVTGSETGFLMGLGITAAITTIVTGWALRRTEIGTRWSLIGESPRAADLIGVDVRMMRCFAAVGAGMTAALAGAVLSVLVARTFTLGIVSGRGWISMCLVILAGWRPQRLLIAVIFWAGLETLGLHLQSRGVNVSYELLLLLPYIGCLIVLAGSKIKSSAPNALLQTYRRNEDAA